MFMQNFNDAVAIISGLNTIPVYRLKKTWAVRFATMLNLRNGAIGS